jgi:hypothetical protein
MINALESLNLTQESQSNARRWVGRGVRALAQLKMLTRMSKCQEIYPRADQHIYRGTPSNRAVGLKSGLTDAVTHMHQTQHSASDVHDQATCPACPKTQRSIYNHLMCNTLGVWLPHLHLLFISMSIIHIIYAFVELQHEYATYSNVLVL